MTWGKSTALGSYSSVSKPKAIHLDITPLRNLCDREAVLSLLPHRVVDIQGAEFHPAARVSSDITAFMSDVLLLTVHTTGGSQKCWESKSRFLFMSYRTWELRRDLSLQPVQLVILNCQDFLLQCSQSNPVSVQNYYVQGILPVVRNVKLQSFLLLSELLTQQECDCGICP